MLYRLTFSWFVGTCNLGHPATGPQEALLNTVNTIPFPGVCNSMYCTVIPSQSLVSISAQFPLPSVELMSSYPLINWNIKTLSIKAKLPSHFPPIQSTWHTSNVKKEPFYCKPAPHICCTWGPQIRS